MIRTKGDFMKAVYTKEELRNIDAGLPKQFWGKIDHFSHVMNYNGDNSCFGKLEDMRKVAKERNIEINGLD